MLLSFDTPLANISTYDSASAYASTSFTPFAWFGSSTVSTTLPGCALIWNLPSSSVITTWPLVVFTLAFFTGSLVCVSNTRP